MKVLTLTEPIVCHVLSCALYTRRFIVPIVQVKKLSKEMTWPRSHTNKADSNLV